ncbi:MAG: hypothetical protein AAB288_12350, partial [Acidobacteriota bacterium]
QRVCWFNLDEVKEMELAYGWQPYVEVFLAHRKNLHVSDLTHAHPNKHSPAIELVVLASQFDLESSTT